MAYKKLSIYQYQNHEGFNPNLKFPENITILSIKQFGFKLLPYHGVIKNYINGN